MRKSFLAILAILSLAFEATVVRADTVSFFEITAGNPDKSANLTGSSVNFVASDYLVDIP